MQIQFAPIGALVEAACLPGAKLGQCAASLPVGEGPWGALIDGELIGVLVEPLGSVSTNRRDVVDYVAAEISDIPEHYQTVVLGELFGEICV
jgi:hypothetical protein